MKCVLHVKLRLHEAFVLRCVYMLNKYNYIWQACKLIFSFRAVQVKKSVENVRSLLLTLTYLLFRLKSFLHRFRSLPAKVPLQTENWLAKNIGCLDWWHLQEVWNTKLTGRSKIWLLTTNRHESFLFDYLYCNGASQIKHGLSTFDISGSTRSFQQGGCL